MVRAVAVGYGAKRSLKKLAVGLCCNLALGLIGIKS